MKVILIKKMIFLIIQGKVVEKNQINLNEIQILIIKVEEK
jgi:hypothetical protein